MIKLLNTICHRTIKIKPADGKSSTYVDFDKENNKVDLNFDVADHVRISKYKIIFPKGDVQNWSEEDFIKPKILYYRQMYKKTLTANKFLEHFKRRNCKR